VCVRTQRRITQAFNEVNAETQQEFHAIRVAWANLRRAYPHLETHATVTLIAEDECGQHRVVCDFVRPIAPPRGSVLSYGPCYSARFVSLVPYRRMASLSGGGRSGAWLAPQVTLLRGAGDVEVSPFSFRFTPSHLSTHAFPQIMRQDHAILLCSLLLGWGMNAYVALGTIASKPAAAVSSSSDVADVEVVPHAWVVTADTALYFWEPLSGTRHEIKGPSRDHPFVDVHVLFRHDSLLVSAQQHTGLRAGGGVGAHGRPYAMPSFDLSDRARWLQVPVHVHVTYQHSVAPLHLRAPLFHPS